MKLQKERIEYSNSHICVLDISDCPVKFGNRINTCNQVDPHDNQQVLSIINCPKCGAGVTHPHVSRSSIHIMYQNRTSNDFQPGDIAAVRKIKSLFAQRSVTYALSKNITIARLNKVLDYGCGNGSFSLAISNVIPFSKVYASDFSEMKPPMLQDSSIEYLSDDHLTEIDGSIDFIFCRHVLEHAYSPRDMLAAMRNKLSLNGVIYIEVPNFNSPLFKIFGKYYVLSYAPFHFFHFTRNSLGLLVESLGLKILSLESGEIPVVGRSLQLFFDSKYYLPLFLLGVLFYPIQLLLGVFYREGSVIRCWAKKI